MSTPNRMQTHWTELRTYIKKEWPKFSDSQLASINGDYDRFLKILRDLYNNFPLEEARARNKLQDYLNTLEDIDPNR